MTSFDKKYINNFGSTKKVEILFCGMRNRLKVHIMTYKSAILIWIFLNPRKLALKEFLIKDYSKNCVNN